MKEKGKIKILGVYDGVGNSYHRVKLPYEALNGQKIEFGGKEYTIETTIRQVDYSKTALTEDDFRDNDIVVNTFCPINYISEVAVWRSKYNTIWINDYDDIIPNSADNPTFTDEFAQFVRAQIIQSVVEADAITVATDPIKTYLSNQNEFVLKIPNYLPFGTGQFVTKKHKEIDKKIAIGIIGSTSHIYDYAELRNIIKKIASDSQIHKNCKFVIAGDKNNKLFNKIVNIFSANKAMEVEIIDSLPCEEYMSLYEKVDILLAPLKDTLFNVAKSSLKLSEAACYSIPVIGSHLYMAKDLTAYCGCKKPSDYYEFIKFFVKNRDRIKELGETFAEQNIADSHWDKRLELLKELIKAVLFEDTFKNLRDKEYSKIWGITFDENQYTEYTPVFNQTKDKPWRFEYNVMLSKLEEIKQESKHVGIFSWKFNQKTNLPKRLLNQLIRENAKYDIIGLAPSLQEGYLSFSYRQHPKLKELLEKVCNKLSLPLPNEVKHAVYSNFFVAKPEIYVKYLEEVVQPALDYMENEIWDEVNVDAEYKSGIEKDRLKELTGLDYYNYVTFVLERLLSIWLENNPQITFLQIN